MSANLPPGEERVFVGTKGSIMPQPIVISHSRVLLLAFATAFVGWGGDAKASIASRSRDISSHRVVAAPQNGRFGGDRLLEVDDPLPSRVGLFLGRDASVVRSYGPRRLLELIPAS